MAPHCASLNQNSPHHPTPPTRFGFESHIDNPLNTLMEFGA
jgi:hypothetical protein